MQMNEAMILVLSVMMENAGIATAEDALEWNYADHVMDQEDVLIVKVAEKLLAKKRILYRSLYEKI